MALTPSELRRRKMNLLMAMSYAAFASTKAETPATSVQIEILTRDASTILTRSGDTIIARTA